MALGIVLLLAGARWWPAQVQRRWRQWPVVVLLAWFSVDGCYFLYWSWRNPEALMMRDVNFPASLCLFIMCGLLWYPRASLQEICGVLRTWRVG